MVREFNLNEKKTFRRFFYIKSLLKICMNGATLEGPLQLECLSVVSYRKKMFKRQIVFKERTSVSTEELFKSY